MLGTPESEHLEVTALNLFHPTALPFLKSWVFHIATQSPEGEVRVGGGSIYRVNLGEG